MAGRDPCQCGGVHDPSDTASAADPASEEHASANCHADGLRLAAWWLSARRLREEIFGSGLFADPAWDILLDLYTAEARGERVQITSLALAARVPHSTAIRWARNMTRAGLLVRQKDPQDGRRIYVELSPHARALMRDFLCSLNSKGAVLVQTTTTSSK